MVLSRPLKLYHFARKGQMWKSWNDWLLDVQNGPVGPAILDMNRISTARRIWNPIMDCDKSLIFPNILCYPWRIRMLMVDWCGHKTGVFVDGKWRLPWSWHTYPDPSWVTLCKMPEAIINQRGLVEHSIPRLLSTAHSTSGMHTLSYFAIQ